MRNRKAEAGTFLVAAFVAAGVLGAMQSATGIPAEMVQLTQFGPALGVLAVALLWPSRIRRRLAGALPGRRTHGRPGPHSRRGDAAATRPDRLSGRRPCRRSRPSPSVPSSPGTGRLAPYLRCVLPAGRSRGPAPCLHHLYPAPT